MSYTWLSLIYLIFFILSYLTKWRCVVIFHCLLLKNTKNESIPSEYREYKEYSATPLNQCLPAQYFIHTTNCHRGWPWLPRFQTQSWDCVGGVSTAGINCAASSCCNTRRCLAPRLPQQIIFFWSRFQMIVLVFMCSSDLQFYLPVYDRKTRIYIYGFFFLIHYCCICYIIFRLGVGALPDRAVGVCHRRLSVTLTQGLLLFIYRLHYPAAPASPLQPAAQSSVEVILFPGEKWLRAPCCTWSEFSEYIIFP